jgi:hypothetical protein
LTVCEANCSPPRPLLGFLVATGALAPALMGWRGAGGGGAANIGVFYFFGGLLQIIGAILEWLVGNTFIYVVFGSFGEYSSHMLAATSCVNIMTDLLCHRCFLARVRCHSHPGIQRRSSIYFRRNDRCRGSCCCSDFRSDTWYASHPIVSRA